MNYYTDNDRIFENIMDSVVNLDLEHMKMLMENVKIAIESLENEETDI